jgi:hypothetical protein
MVLTEPNGVRCTDVAFPAALSAGSVPVTPMVGLRLIGADDGARI